MITTKEITDKKTWEKFLEKHEEANFLQSWNWGEFHTRLGKKIFRTGFYDGEKHVGILLSIIEVAKRGKYLTVPGGPIIDWDNKDVVNSFIQEVKDVARENRCVFVRVRPQLFENDFSKNLFQKYSFKHASMHLHAELTSQIDIKKSEEELLAQMRKTTRYEIKKAQKIGVKITTNSKEDDIQKFYNLQIETSRRQHFVPFSFRFLQEQFKTFLASDQAVLYTAMLEKKILAQAFIIFYGAEAVYHYGASTDEGRHYPGAYLIQWEAIKEAKKRKMKRYNLWGIANNPKHRFYGISIFKRGFGGEDIQYLPAHDLVIDPIRYFFNWTVETVRKKIRRV